MSNLTLSRPTKHSHCVILTTWNGSGNSRGPPFSGGNRMCWMAGRAKRVFCDAEGCI